jgi:translocator protein
VDRRAWTGLAGWLLVCFAAAAIGGQFTPGVWYDRLAKPEWTPPDWLFGPVWTVLYAMMAVAAWLVWRRTGFAEGRWALGLFALQLVLNAGWSAIFFGLQRPGLALAEILLLWVVILATLIAFWRVRPLAGALLVPYLAWVSTATALNFEIWRMNV